MVNDSILETVKNFCGGGAELGHFEPELIIHTNTALAYLNQLGVGPSNGFRITGNTETWQDFLGDEKNIEHAKDYVCIKVKLMFDPPQSSAAQKSLQEAADEATWRIGGLR